MLHFKFKKYTSMILLKIGDEKNIGRLASDINFAQDSKHWIKKFNFNTGTVYSNSKWDQKINYHEKKKKIAVTFVTKPQTWCENKKQWWKQSNDSKMDELWLTYKSLVPKRRSP